MNSSNMILICIYHKFLCQVLKLYREISYFHRRNRKGSAGKVSGGILSIHAWELVSRNSMMPHA